MKVIVASLYLSPIIAFQTVQWNSAIAKISELSSIYASKNVFDDVQAVQKMDLKSNSCLPSPKYSTRRYQLTQSAGTVNSLKFLWRDVGVPAPPPGTPVPKIEKTSIGGARVVTVSGFPAAGWPASTMEYQSRVFTLEKVLIKAASDFYVAPSPNSAEWFPVQMDFIHTFHDNGETQTLIVSTLWTTCPVSSIFVEALTRKLITGTGDIQPSELNLGLFMRIELDNLKTGYYIMDPADKETCKTLWIVSNKPLQMGSYQYDELMKHIDVNESSDAPADVFAEKSSSTFIVKHWFQYYAAAALAMFYY